MTDASPLQPLLEAILQRKGIAPRLKAYEAWRYWNSVVGPQIAQQAQPLRFRDGVLEVRVNHPVWMQQLTLLKPRILKQLNQQLGEEILRDIYFRRGQVIAPPVSVAEDRPWKKLVLDEKDHQAVEEQISALEDNGLKDCLRRLLLQEQQLKKHRQSG